MTQNSLTEYLLRMKNCQQFDMFRILPQWVPGAQDVEGFIHDEVVRQYHNPAVYQDGGCRIEFMTAAWKYAVGTSQIRPEPSVEDILNIAKLAEPHMNSFGFRTIGVQVGGHIAPGADQLVGLMNELWFDGMSAAKLTAMRGGRIDAEEALPIEGLSQGTREQVDAFYVAYETLHPFSDGNGRSGKILHNWLLGTLEDPVLVADYFGGGNP